MKRLAIATATGLYSGYAPIAPGTAGSVVGLLTFVLLRASGSMAAELTGIVTLFGVGVWSATIAERHFGRSDPGAVVIDEVVGMLITLALIPMSWPLAVLGFFLFRAFDIVKPYPVGRLERLPDGWGVMADDVMAGIYSNVALRGLVWLLPAWLG